jgi:asparagine synthase (glutamine-hydrolysing)
VVFGSEIKSILAHPEVQTGVDEAQIASFFRYGYVPHPNTLYRGVRQLDPASLVTIECDGRVSSRQYWQLEFPPEGAAPPVTREDARERIRDLVTAAVRRRLVSDVPLGAFLSGGIDSAIVVGVMSRLMKEPVKTFTIGFEGEPVYDETAVARQVATSFGTEHTQFLARPDTVALIDRLVWHHDGPFGDSSAIPTFLVSQLTREHVTVVLTGDGGDESFAGYLRFRAALAAQSVPRAAGALLSASLRLLPGAPNERHLLSRARRFARHMHLPLVERAARWNSVFPDDLTELLQPEVAPAGPSADGVANRRHVMERIRQYSPLGQLLAANFESYLPDDLLVKTDRCTMANSLEARAPFLDTSLVQYAASLPDEFKLAGRTTKAILREAFADLVPPIVMRQPKRGFGVPLDAWFRGPLREYVRDTLVGSSVASHQFVRRDAIERVIREHETGRANAGHRLWALVSFERWLKLWPELVKPSDVAGGAGWTATPGRSTMLEPLR